MGTPEGDTAVPRRILPVIVLAQFAGTSLWFAVNAVLPDLLRSGALPPTALATLTGAVQLGFVAGTLMFAILMVADRFPPARVFLACALFGAACNVALLAFTDDYAEMVALRFAVGFFLAGIYPVGMKIAASWYREGLGAALGVLVGALVLGTALPHGLRAIAGLSSAAPWQAVIIGVSLLAVLGGMATAYWVPERPHAPSQKFSPRALGVIATEPKLRASVLGYFGHMWELYAFYALVPAIVATRASGSAASGASFGVIGAGAIGCIVGGLVARRAGSATVAFWQLAASGTCCLASPWMLDAPLPVFASWLLVWGTTVAGDSPQFSTLTARNAPPAVVGSVLTLTNSIGFAISVVSVSLFARAAASGSLASLLPWLAVGPALGLLALSPLLRR